MTKKIKYSINSLYEIMQKECCYLQKDGSLENQ